MSEDTRTNLSRDLGGCHRCTTAPFNAKHRGRHTLTVLGGGQRSLLHMLGNAIFYHPDGRIEHSTPIIRGEAPENWKIPLSKLRISHRNVLYRALGQGEILDPYFHNRFSQPVI